MEFLHTGLLWMFLPLAAIPIILHLLTLHRLKTVELSTFRFLFDSYVQQRRRMKFLEALIAMLRAAFILFLVFCIARPVVKHWDKLFGGGGSGRDIVLMIDGSASMGAVTDGVTGMERAKQAALKVVERLGSEDRVTVLRVADKPEEVCNRFSSDTEQIRSEIERLKPTPSRANLFAAMSYVYSQRGGDLKKPLVYLFSDLQASGWNEFEDGQAASLVPEDAEIIVVNAGSNQTLPNRAIVGGAPGEQRAIAGLPITLRPKVANYSAEETQDVTVSILIDEKEIGRKSLTLKPGETRAAEIVYTPTEAGVLKGRYEIESDRFSDDDSFMFTVAVAPRVKVLLVNGNPAAVPLENAGLYLRTAMVATESDFTAAIEAETQADSDGKDKAAGDGAQPKKATDPQADARDFVRSLDVVDVPEAHLNAETLRDVEVVVLANCGALKSAQYQLLCQYVADGGGLLILPGDKVNPALYNKQFLPAPALPDQQLVAATLEGPLGDPKKAETFARFGAVDLAHPVFSVFSDSEKRYLAKVLVYRHFGLKLAEDAGNTWPLASFTAGGPALIESRYGNGRVVLSGFAFHAQWSNLPLKPEFVPLVLRMISYVRRSADVRGPSVVAADAPAEFTVAQSWAPVSGKVTDRSGRITPVSFQRSKSQLRGAFEGTAEKGFYTIDVRGGRAEQPKQAQWSFAVNVAAEESDFSGLGKPQLESMMPAAKVTLVDASAEAQQEFGSIGQEREIWRPLIFLLFLIIGVEFMLSTLSGHVAADGEEPPSTTQRIQQLASGRWVGQMTGARIEEEAVGSGRN